MRASARCVTFRRMHRAILLVTLLAAACGASQSSPSTTPTAGAGPGSDQECHEETPTGSSISHQVCRSKFQSDQDKKGAQDFLNSPRPAAGRPGN